MNERPDEDDGIILPTALSVAEEHELPYAVVLMDLPRASVEGVLARAASLGLAHAIYAAAQSEHLGRKIILMRGETVVTESD